MREGNEIPIPEIPAPEKIVEILSRERDESHLGTYFQILRERYIDLSIDEQLDFIAMRMDDRHRRDHDGENPRDYQHFDIEAFLLGTRIGLRVCDEQLTKFQINQLEGALDDLHESAVSYSDAYSGMADKERAFLYIFSSQAVTQQDEVAPYIQYLHDFKTYPYHGGSSKFEIEAGFGLLVYLKNQVKHPDQQ